MSSDPLDWKIKEKAETDGQYAIAWGLLCIATQLKWLGTGDAATTMGAIEYLTTKIEESGRAIAEPLDSLAAAVQEVASALSKIAEATKETNDKLNEIADAIEDAATKPAE
jgi:methyl-accepting chemotaxis protein